MIRSVVNFPIILVVGGSCGVVARIEFAGGESRSEEGWGGAVFVSIQNSDDFSVASDAYGGCSIFNCAEILNAAGLEIGHRDGFWNWLNGFHGRTITLTRKMVNF